MFHFLPGIAKKGGRKFGILAGKGNILTGILPILRRIPSFLAGRPRNLRGMGYILARIADFLGGIASFLARIVYFLAGILKILPEFGDFLAGIARILRGRRKRGGAPAARLPGRATNRTGCRWREPERGDGTPSSEAGRPWGGGVPGTGAS
jgi:hypothetical protein